MKRFGEYVIDATLCGSILMVLYFHAFRRFDHGPLWFYRWNGIILSAAVISIFTLPFRLKRYPRLLTYIAYDKNGARRKSIVIPLLWFVPVVIGTIIVLRVIVTTIEYVGQLG